MTAGRVASGMVVRWRRLMGPGWQRSAAINAFAAFVTGVVLCVVVATKFSRGAWTILTAIPIVIFLMRAVHAHYTAVAHQLADEERRPVDRRPGHQHMVILVSNVDAAYARAMGYSGAVRPSSISAVTTTLPSMPHASDSRRR